MNVNNPEENEASKHQILDMAGERAADHAGFLAGVIKYYQAKFEIPDSELIDWLGITPDNFSLLKLCKVPRPGNWYHADITAITARFRIIAGNLETMLDGKMSRPAQVRLQEQVRLEAAACVVCNSAFPRIKQDQAQAFCSTNCLNRAVREYTNVADQSYRFTDRQDWANTDQSRATLKELYPND